MRSGGCFWASVVVATLLRLQTAWAQGGPPFVTDDPATPGAGHWEVNIAGIASHQRDRWALVGPDADINYGWGERVQLKLDLNWTTTYSAGSATRSGLGTSAIGVKWRMVGGDDGGFALSTYPQLLLQNPGDPHKELFLPLEAAITWGAFHLDAEAGPEIVEQDSDEWAMGVIAARACNISLECGLEVHETLSAGGGHMTLINLGFRQRLNETLTLLVAAGRDFGTPVEARQKLLLYVGIQVVK